VDAGSLKTKLLNSARKTPGWTNNTVNVNGVLTTTQGLDFNVGAGALDLNTAYDQYLTGTTNNVPVTGGTLHPLGWTLGHVKGGANGAPNDYFVDVPLTQGAKFTATLDWFIPVFFNANGTVDANDDFSKADLHDLYFDQLGLQLWKVENGVPTTLVADAHSPYNNVDHLWLDVPSDGLYAIRVSFLGTTYDVGGTSPLEDDYGLAWSVTPAAVPEPGTLGAGLVAVAGLLLRSRKRR